MSDRKTGKPTSSPRPAPAMQAMAAVFAKAAGQETGAEAKYLSRVAEKAAQKADEARRIAADQRLSPQTRHKGDVSARLLTAIANSKPRE